MDMVKVIIIYKLYIPCTESADYCYHSVYIHWTAYCYTSVYRFVIYLNHTL